MFIPKQVICPTPSHRMELSLRLLFLFQHPQPCHLDHSVDLNNSQLQRSILRLSSAISARFVPRVGADTAGPPGGAGFRLSSTANSTMGRRAPPKTVLTDHPSVRATGDEGDAGGEIGRRVRSEKGEPIVEYKSTGEL